MKIKTEWEMRHTSSLLHQPRNSSHFVLNRSGRDKSTFANTVCVKGKFCSGLSLCTFDSFSLFI